MMNPQTPDRLCIVVADDDADILRLVSTRLTKRGFAVVTASNGREALEAVREHRPAAAVLDRVMPELEGVAVCAAVKADPELAHIPIVLLTARASENDVVDGFEAGADEYLTKPFEIEELDGVLRRLTGAA